MKLVLAVSALSAGLACSLPAAAAADPEAGSYVIAAASQSRGKYPYLTIESVAAKLKPRFAAQVPTADSSRLVVLNVDFRATGGRGELRKLDPADLQVQWAFADGTRGAAPVLGTHLGKDLITMVGSQGFYTSMRPDTYEVFAIVPKAARAIDLAQRQPDGAFKPVKANIKLSAAK